MPRVGAGTPVEREDACEQRDEPIEQDSDNTANHVPSDLDAIAQLQPFHPRELRSHHMSTRSAALPNRATHQSESAGEQDEKMCDDPATLRLPMSRWRRCGLQDRHLKASAARRMLSESTAKHVISGT
jgi:hypothetical protein